MGTRGNQACQGAPPNPLRCQLPRWHDLILVSILSSHFDFSPPHLDYNNHLSCLHPSLSSESASSPPTSTSHRPTSTTTTTSPASTPLSHLSQHPLLPLRLLTAPPRLQQPPLLPPPLSLI